MIGLIRGAGMCRELYPCQTRPGTIVISALSMEQAKGNLMFSHYNFRYLTRALFLSALAVVLFCSDTARAGERYTVVGTIANIRSGPGTNHEILCQAEKYYPLNLVKRSGNWYKVEDFEGDVGWIHKSLVNKVPSVITTVIV